MRLLAPILVTLLALVSVSPIASAQDEFRSNHFQTSDGVELHYLEAGSGPLLVFVPGWTMPAWIWQPQLDHFASSYHVVALDPRGHGRSEKATQGYTATRQSQDVCELLNHLDRAPAVIVGWSIAGQHVLLCAGSEDASVVRAVVVVDWDIRLEADREFTASRVGSVQGDREAFTRALIEGIHVDAQPHYVEALTEAVLDVPTNAAAMMTTNWYFFGPHDMGPTLDALDRPVLMVYSSLDWAVEAAEEARAGWPALRVEVIDGTSHALFADRPDAFNRILEEFLASLRD